ncbi:MAG: 4-hydroxy-3-methylbut-2-enyl diphosphate reductase [Verrucomicrobia bacterium]|nr:4-hydroxy-3-methylbut-2-enyl diphosphate reductase [Verrucomicrobiota bacterium]
MCFGVRDAIALAKSHAAHGPVTVLGPLAHNPAVVADLNALGVRVDPSPGGIPGGTGPLMITAHGASKRRLAALEATGRPVIEATCPLVRAAHRALEKLAAEGCFPVVIGQRDHVEVRGMTEDFDEHAVILNDADVDALPAMARFGIVAQTTQPIEKVRRLVERCRERFPASEVRYLDTVCSPTKSRQQAAVALAQRCHRVLVIGGRNSNNTQELVATCSLHCERVHHIESAEELRATWFEAGETVGVTAGTSTPDSVIDAVERWLEEFNRFQSKLHSTDGR